MRSSADEEGTQAHIFRVNADGSIAFVCLTPCTKELLPGVRLQVTLGQDEENAQTYVVPKRPGREVDLMVRPASKVGFKVVGAVTLAGGAFAIVGGTAMKTAGEGGTTPTAGLVTVTGLVLIVVGAAAVFAGITFLSVGPSSRPAVDTTVRRERAGRARVQLTAGARGVGFTF